MTRCIHERDHKSCEECRPSDHARITPQELAEKVRAGIETYHYPEAEWHQALEALAELVRLAEEAERANLEWQKQIDYAQERAEAAETALQDAVEVAEEAVADADRKTEALRKIAHDCGSVYGYPDGARFVARAALGEDE